DAGNTFGANVLVYQSPDGHVCECCHPSVAFDSAGGIHVMFRNWIDGNRDLWITSSRDGQHFDRAQKLGRQSWKLNACPMDGGGLIFNTKSRAVNAVYRRASDILFTDLNSEAQLAQGTQPTITAGPTD